MELLLALLSLLTAATGAVGARAPEAGVHQSAAGIVAVAPARRATPNEGGSNAAPAPVGREAPVAAPTASPREAAPLATERLIE